MPNFLTEEMPMYDMNSCSCGCPLLHALENLFSTGGCCGCNSCNAAGRSGSCYNQGNSCSLCNACQRSGFGSCSSLWCCTDAYYARQYGLSANSACACSSSRSRRCYNCCD